MSQAVGSTNACDVYYCLPLSEFVPRLLGQRDDRLNALAIEYEQTGNRSTLSIGGDQPRISGR